MTTDHPWTSSGRPALPKPPKPPRANIQRLMGQGPLPMFARRYCVLDKEQARARAQLVEWIEGERGPPSDPHAGDVLLEADLKAAVQHAEWCAEQIAQGRAATPCCANCNRAINFYEPPAGETEDPRRNVKVVEMVCTYSGTYKFAFYCRECCTRALPPLSVKPGSL
jgi:hypothetical protein